MKGGASVRRDERELAVGLYETARAILRKRRLLGSEDEVRAMRTGIDEARLFLFDGRDFPVFNALADAELATTLEALETKAAGPALLEWLSWPISRGPCSVMWFSWPGLQVEGYTL